MRRLNLLAAIFGDQRIKELEKKVNETQVSKTVFSHLSVWIDRARRHDVSQFLFVHWLMCIVGGARMCSISLLLKYNLILRYEARLYYLRASTLCRNLTSKRVFE